MPRSRTITAMIALALSAPLIAATPAKKPAPAHKPAGNGDVTRAQMQANTKRVFDRADTNHDGFMSRKEFAARMTMVLNGNAPTREEAQRMLDAANRAFDDVDTNHDGKLSLAEASKRPMQAFDMMDANHDGVLTLAEKRAAHENAPTLPAGPPQPTQGEQAAPGR